MTKIKQIIKNIIEQIRVNPAVVRSALAALVGLGVINITDTDISQIEQLVLALIVLLGGVSTSRVVIPERKFESDDPAYDKYQKVEGVYQVEEGEDA